MDPRGRADESPRLSPALASDVLNALTAQIAVLDSGGVVVAVNEAWRQFARENGGEVQGFYVGANYLTVCEAAVRRDGDETVEAVLRGLRAVLRGEQESFALEYPCHSPGEERWFVVRATRCCRDSTPGLVVSHENITARKRVEDELQQALAREQLMARTDNLTGVNNRRYFFDLVEHDLAVALRYRHPLSVILFDIDHFKGINDTFGHQVGDEVLKRVARIAREHLREADVLARYGGEEFILALPDSDAQQATVVAERIREGIAAQGIDTDQGRVRVTISAGVADVASHEDVLDRLIQRADQALYTAKQAGRNRTRIFSPTVH